MDQEAQAVFDAVTANGIAKDAVGGHVWPLACSCDYVFLLPSRLVDLRD